VNQWVDESNQRDHRQTMEKLSKAVEIARAISTSGDTHSFEMDVHIDRYGDTKITVRVTKATGSTEERSAQ